jgi:hypothetical protein
MSNDPSDKSRPGKVPENITAPGLEALSKAADEKATKRLSAKESSDLFMARAMENLRKAGEEARQRGEEESRYQRLSEEEWDSVAEDLKEHLRITEKQRRFEKLVNGMMDSVPKDPTIH